MFAFALPHQKYAQVDGFLAQSSRPLDGTPSDVQNALVAALPGIRHALPKSVEIAPSYQDRPRTNVLPSSRAFQSSPNRTADPIDVIDQECDSTALPRRRDPFRRNPYRIQCPKDGCTVRVQNTCLLEDHMNLHNGVKPYCCTRCMSLFGSKLGLSVHYGMTACSRSQAGSSPPHGTFPARAQALPLVRPSRVSTPNWRLQPPKKRVALECLVEKCGERFESVNSMRVHQNTRHGLLSSGLVRGGKFIASFRRLDGPTGQINGSDTSSARDIALCRDCGRSFIDETGRNIHISKKHRPPVNTRSILDTRFPRN